MTDWDERFRRGDYPADPEPSPVLRARVEAFPDGRALDVAAGTGRNAVFLAERGYRVDGLDRSRVGLEIARSNARERGVDDRTNWIRADVGTYCFPTATYDVVTVSFFRVRDRLLDLTEALAPGGVLFLQHHLRTTDDVDVGPSDDRHRVGANELLRACLGLTVLHYDERTERRDGRTGAVATVVARNSAGSRQSYPELDDRP
jgi:SAM-dependent methyltransferase